MFLYGEIYSVRSSHFSLVHEVLTEFDHIPDQRYREREILVPLQKLTGRV